MPSRALIIGIVVVVVIAASIGVWLLSGGSPPDAAEERGEAGCDHKACS
jgi:hypothetical protein